MPTNTAGEGGATQGQGLVVLIVVLAIVFVIGTAKLASSAVLPRNLRMRLLVPIGLVEFEAPVVSWESCYSLEWRRLPLDYCMPSQTTASK